MEELGFGFSLSPTEPIASIPILRARTVLPGAGDAVGPGVPEPVGRGLFVACATQTLLELQTVPEVQLGWHCKFTFVIALQLVLPL